jgi:hypothetical protein
MLLSIFGSIAKLLIGGSQAFACARDMQWCAAGIVVVGGLCGKPCRKELLLQKLQL